ncbi:hypothetical protein RDWZM_005768 [Blomia tropicalis]|uniref:Peroxisomal multifunctional enzyme type 2 n=1 Tax=Blomia tropicalis TaxID=40697 RepID=A0A9Q0RNR0_BLOTA|nr:hypothetical protein RDWZM_005768 [Blomia tropicalis]
MDQNDILRFDDRVVIITGAARGLGREYALLLASRGASVVVNDLGGGRDGTGRSAAADDVVQQIRQSGGKAVADYNSVEEGQKIVETAIQHFGKIDIIINNAGILRDKSMMKLTDDDWDMVHRVHLRGAFIITRAAWPYFRKQNYGRIIMTSSPSGIYGNFGQANYSSAKLGLLSLAKTLSVEGEKYNIKCNTILPVAASRLTEDLFPEDILNLFLPKYVAPIVVYLCHESCLSNGDVFEAAGGFYGQYRWQRSKGKVFSNPDLVTPEDVRNAWNEVTNMTEFSSPSSMQDHTLTLVDQLKNENHSDIFRSEDQLQKSVDTNQSIFTYTSLDAILYALSVGITTNDPFHLSFLYEANDPFIVLPTFGTTVSLNAVFDQSVIQDAISRYNLEDNLIRTLHGEQYLKLYQPIPASGKLTSKPRLIDVLDKGAGALILIDVPTYDESGTLMFRNQLSLMMMGSGNFGGKRSTEDESVVSVVDVPKRQPDAIIYQQTTSDQAAIYRLCGDLNPLHIDPTFSTIGGFERPILHGLCTLGFATRHVMQCFVSNVDDVQEVFDACKARFVGAIIPGQTIETRCWRSHTNSGGSSGIADHQLTRIHFECYVKETGNKIISSAFVDLKLPVDTVASIPPLPPSASNVNIVTLPHSNFNTDIPNTTTMSPTDTTRVGKIFDTEVRKKISQHPDIFARLNTIFEFNIIKDGLYFTWIIDLKSKPAEIYEGSPKNDQPADVMITVEDHLIVDIFEGKEDSILAFMSGKLTATGNVLLAQKLLQNLTEPSVLTEDEDKKLLSSIPISGLKSDLVFTLLRNRMHEEPDFIRRIRASYQFNITLNGKYKTTWTAENKSEANGCVYNGPFLSGKADCIVTVEDEDFIKLMFGKLNPQRAFMLGKLKVKGNIILLQRLNSLWIELLKSGKAPEFPYIMDLMSRTDLIAGFRSEVMIIELIQRLIRLPYLCKEIGSMIGFEILKDSKVSVEYTLDFTKNQETGVFDRGIPKGGNYCILTLSDEDFTRLTYHKFTLEQVKF